MPHEKALCTTVFIHIFVSFFFFFSLSTFFSGDCSSVAKSIPIPAQPYGAVLCTNRVQGTVPTLSTCHPVNMPPCKHASSTSLSGKHTWVFPPGSHGGQLDAESSPRCAQVTAPGFLGVGGGGDPDRQSSYQVLHCWGLSTGHQTKQGWLLCAVNKLCLVCWPVERPQLSSTPSPPCWELIPHPHPAGNPYPTLLGTHTPSPPCWEQTTCQHNCALSLSLAINVACINIQSANCKTFFTSWYARPKIVCNGF